VVLMESREKLEEYLRRNVCAHPVKVLKTKIVMHLEDYLTLLKLLRVRDKYPSFNPCSWTLVLERKVVTVYKTPEEYFWLILGE